MPTDQFGNTAGIKPIKISKESAKSGDGPKPENTKPNNSKESAQSGDGPKPENTKPNNSKESNPSEDGPKPKPKPKPINSKESAQSGDGPSAQSGDSKESNPSGDTPPVAPIEPDSTLFPSPPTYMPTLMPSFGGTVTVSTEVTAPPTVAGRSDEPV
jgi:hypothetical protein